MRCPRCDLASTEPVAECAGCGFSLRDLVSQMVALPDRSGRIVDTVGMLSDSGHARITDRLDDFVATCGHEAIVVTVEGTSPLRPAEYAFGLFEHWKVGGPRRDGVMMLVARAERRVECVLGPAIAPALSRASTNALLSRHVAPHLTRGDLDGGIFHGVDMLARVFEHAEGHRG